MKLRIASIFLLAFASLSSRAQSQLVLFKGEKVMARYSYGDNFSYKLKKARHYKHTFVTDVREFSVVTFNDTVPFSQIDRVSLKGQQRKTPRVSKLLIAAGILYFSLDQINNVLIHGNRADMPASVWKPSLAFVSVGLVLKFAHKTSQRIRYPARLFAAPRGSQFYHYDE